MARILVIEDEVPIQKIWQRALKEHQLTVVSSGSAAIEALDQKELFDIVISDHNIEGGMTGIDVYLFAFTKAPAYNSRYIFCSANNKAKAFAESQGITFFEKPFPAMLLKQELQRKLDRQAFLDETDTVPFGMIVLEEPASEAAHEAFASS